MALYICTEYSDTSTELKFGKLVKNHHGISNRVEYKNLLFHRYLQVVSSCRSGKINSFRSQYN
jgi:hypothetical protein